MAGCAPRRAVRDARRRARDAPRAVDGRALLVVVGGVVVGGGGGVGGGGRWWWWCVSRAGGARGREDDVCAVGATSRGGGGGGVGDGAMAIVCVVRVGVVDVDVDVGGERDAGGADDARADGVWRRRRGGRDERGAVQGGECG